MEKFFGIVSKALALKKGFQETSPSVIPDFGVEFKLKCSMCVSWKLLFLCVNICFLTSRNESIKNCETSPQPTEMSQPLKEEGIYGEIRKNAEIIVLRIAS